MNPLDPNQSIQSQLNDKKGFLVKKVNQYFKYMIDNEGYRYISDVNQLTSRDVLKMVTKVNTKEDFNEQKQGYFYRTAGLVLNIEDDYFVTKIFNKSISFSKKNFLFGIAKKFSTSIKPENIKFTPNPKYIGGKNVVKDLNGEIIYAARDKYRIELFLKSKKYKSFIEHQKKLANKNEQSQPSELRGS